MVVVPNFTCNDTVEPNKISNNEKNSKTAISTILGISQEMEKPENLQGTRRS